MNFFVAYFKLIDLLALAALAALACAALVRNRSVWLFVAGIVVAIWGAMRSRVGLDSIIDGGWKATHEHFSVPFYMDGSDKAAVELKP